LILSVLLLSEIPNLDFSKRCVITGATIEEVCFKGY
jgi:hypothetical protein